MYPTILFITKSGISTFYILFKSYAPGIFKYFYFFFESLYDVYGLVSELCFTFPYKSYC